MQQKTKNVKSLKIAVLSVAILLVAVLTLGFSTAWFTDFGNLNGSGTTPNVEVQAYVGTTKVENNLVSYNQIANGTEYLNNLNFKYENTSIDVLARFRVIINFYNNGEVLADGDFADWYELSIPTTWTKSGDFYYHKTKLEKNVKTATTMVQSLTITSDLANGKDVEVLVFVEAVQANTLGINKFKGENNEYVLPTSYADGTILG